MAKVVIKKNKENPFVQIYKEPLSDDRLSWKAKGIWAYLLSKPDDWVVRITDLIRRSKDSRDSVYTGLTELEKYGYLTRERCYNEKGQFMGYDYIIYEAPLPIEEVVIEKRKKSRKVKDQDMEKPYTEKPYMVEKPYMEKPYMEKPYTEKPMHNNKELIINNDRITTTTTTNVKDVVVEPLNFDITIDTVLEALKGLGINSINKEIIKAFIVDPEIGINEVEKQLINTQAEIARRKQSNLSPLRSVSGYFLEAVKGKYRVDEVEAIKDKIAKDKENQKLGEILIKQAEEELVASSEIHSPDLMERMKQIEEKIFATPKNRREIDWANEPNSLRKEVDWSNEPDSL
ncbi:helix-turn-helix domain-containing protein [Pelosinus propionicus]|uniref:Helix-turn-helix domain-containing protein n=1 Tax=Pelosinus propionicus DSM 13327 TaxID=1123291 RepID=A0A1I4PT50_9FIRM|nr:helix-turn-helix domain-containing protein [Pelosinus propionicus]SFM31022.1 hypothetical protein SAMN04490355_107221 [Pelosinus propionicus DSM 13327]